MIEIFQSEADGQWRFHLKSANGEIVCSSEAYTRKADAVRGANTLVTTILGMVRVSVSERRIRFAGEVAE